MNIWSEKKIEKALIKYSKETPNYWNKIQENLPQKEIENKMYFKIPNLSKNFFKYALCCTLAIIILFSGILLPTNLKRNTLQDSNLSKKNGVNNKSSNLFTITAYAAEHNGPEAMDITKTKTLTLTANTKVEMPFGKIQRGALNTFTYDNGEAYKGYESSYDFDGGFIVSGDNVESITYSSSNGTLEYFDVDKYLLMLSQGEIYVCSIDLMSHNITGMSLDELREEFFKLWNSGTFDEYKNKYFKDKPLTLDDYGLHFETKDGDNGKFIATKINIRSKADYEESSSKYEIKGSSVVAKAGSPVSWIPSEKAFDMVMAYGELNYEDLIGDTVTIITKFKNGETKTQTIDLSFDKDGNLIGELK